MKCKLSLNKERKHTPTTHTASTAETLIEKMTLSLLVERDRHEKGNIDFNHVANLCSSDLDFDLNQDIN